MSKRYIIEKEWVTAVGLNACVVKAQSLNRHRCGYVAVTKDSPLFGVSYHRQIPQITREMVETATLGNKSPLLVLTASAGADSDACVRRSLDVIINVHGGLTYSSTGDDPTYPVASLEGAPLWWFGFDCNHWGDSKTGIDGGQTLEYCMQECELMAKQLKEFDNETV